MKIDYSILSGFITILACIFVSMVGWVSNLIWLISDGDFTDAAAQTVLSMVGLIAVPIGIVHGLFVLF